MAADVAEPGFGRRRCGGHVTVVMVLLKHRQTVGAEELRPKQMPITRSSSGRVAASDQARPTTSFCLTRRLEQTDEPTIHESLNPDRRSGELLAGLISAATPRLAAALLLLP